MSTTTTPTAAPAWTPPPFAEMFMKPEAVGHPELIAIYGDAGTWKSSTAAAIVEVPQFADKRVLLIDVDKGASVLVNNPAVKRKIDNGTFNVLPIDKTAPNAFEQLVYFLGYQDDHGNWQAGQAFQHGYDVVILDTLDVAQEVAVTYLTHNTYNDAGNALNTQKAWGLVKAWTLGLSWAMKNATALGIQVIHAKEETEAGRLKIKPSLSGGAKDALTGIPDLVAYVDFEQDPADKDKTRLVATIGENAVTETKNRWMLPSKVPNFTLPLLFQMIEERRNDTNQKIAANAA